MFRFLIKPCKINLPMHSRSLCDKQFVAMLVHILVVLVLTMMYVIGRVDG